MVRPNYVVGRGFFSGFHPDPKGAARLADIIAEALKQ